jgi:hypothetical protein
MDANRLETVRQALRAYEKQGLCDSRLFEEIRQQQADIERLNRAYEEAIKGLQWIYESTLYAQSKLDAKRALSEAQQIKEGKDGDQG